jgi:hypothetical protein
MKSTNVRRWVVFALLLVVAAAAPLFAADETIEEIAIPQAVIDVYAENGVDQAILEKEWADLTWEEKSLLREVREDADVNPVVKGVIVTALMAEMTPDVDGVCTKIAGVTYTHRRPEEE